MIVINKLLLKYRNKAIYLRIKDRLNQEYILFRILQ